MPRNWTQEEHYRLSRAYELYDNQISLLMRCETFPGRTRFAVEHKSKTFRYENWKPPKGLKTDPLRIESEPDVVREEIADYLESNPNARLTMPSVLSGPVGMDANHQKIIRILKREPISVYDLADKVDLSPRKVKKAVSWLKSHSYLVNDDLENLSIEKPDPTFKSSQHSIPIDRLFSGGWVKFGVLSDPHIGSRWTRWDVLETLFDIYQDEGVSEVYLPGNMCEGEARFNKQDVKIWGFENQIHYAVDRFPQRDGITTNFITADDHES